MLWEYLLKSLRAAGVRNIINANPGQLDLANKLSKRYMELGKAKADRRYYGTAKSYDFLRGALKVTQVISTDQRLWSLTVLAEIASRIDKDEKANQFPCFHSMPVDAMAKDYFPGKNLTSLTA